MQIPEWTTAAALLFVAAAVDAHAEYVRCTSKDGRSSVIRRDKCDSPDDIRTSVQPKAALPAGAAPSGKAADDPMAAYRAGDYARARELFEPRARAGDPIAQIMMGDMYKNGRGVPKDERVGYTWTRMAADQGDARGQAALAALMQAGRGTPRDEAGALIWLQKSANQGYVIAQAALGYAYRVGLGTPKDEAMAVLWLRKAAAQGNADATDMLRQMGR